MRYTLVIKILNEATSSQHQHTSGGTMQVKYWSMWMREL